MSYTQMTELPKSSWIPFSVDFCGSGLCTRILQQNDGLPLTMAITLHKVAEGTAMGPGFFAEQGRGLEN